MRSNTTIVVIRSVMALLLAGLGLVSLVDGRVIVGVLLLGMAVMHVALIVAMSRRRRQWRARIESRRGSFPEWERRRGAM